ncbi:hypothetical protein PGTUg99_006288 [Puccinia graminis f. sp. tritici]|uniref:Uncharacterized protein n=1 Tax=Puccinia graminis f. sp. tritici TaxID=56615 RepID=A0A5B0QTV7_PUCGR|nr:hypothetical protein PGTUg99_006288 [Puccinia graminis f. sp. tritici]
MKLARERPKCEEQQATGVATVGIEHWQDYLLCQLARRTPSTLRRGGRATFYPKSNPTPRSW